MAGRRGGKEGTDPEVEKDKKKRVNREGLKVLFQFLRYVKPYSGIYALGFVFLIGGAFTALGFPFFTSEVIKLADGETSKYASSLDVACLIMVGILALQALFSFVRVATFSYVAEKSMGDIRRDVYARVVALPMSFFDKRRVGELTSRITADVQNLQSLLSTTLAEFIRQIAVLILGTAILIFLSPKLTLYMLAVFPPLVIVAFVFGRAIRKLSRKTQDDLAATNTIAEESLQNITVVKAFANENLEVGRYTSSLQRVIKNAITGAGYRGAFISFMILGLMGSLVFVVWLGATQMGLDGEDLLRFVLISGFIGGSVGGLGEVYGEIQKAIGASERLRELLGESTEVNASQPAPQSVPLKGRIEYQEVSFRYPTREDVQVLKGVTLHAAEGEKIALAGSSGAGKSTIVQLLLRFYSAGDGQILIDGKPINSYDLRSFRSNIGIVPQEVILFGGTIRENIGYGKPGATDKEIEEAATKANAIEFIRQFPEGLNTLVGERGVKLSGGQRQRIAIARAILRDPRILILDEATSSLDAESEKLVQDALDRLMQGRTTLIIAHRLSTIRNVDRIYVLDKGKIAEVGTHDELAAKEEGIYSRLVKLQMLES
jgi:ABC-type multidrug transport system fused ATPase/permease subunit